MEDILPVTDARVQGQFIFGVFVNEGAKVCVMSKMGMHCLGLEVDGPAPCKTKLANNTNVCCVGLIKALKVKILKVVVDVFVMPSKEEGYPMM